jgi:streptogramin lyase
LAKLSFKTGKIIVGFHYGLSEVCTIVSIKKAFKEGFTMVFQSSSRKEKKISVPWSVRVAARIAVSLAMFIPFIPVPSTFADSSPVFEYYNFDSSANNFNNFCCTQVVEGPNGNEWVNDPYGLFELSPSGRVVGDFPNDTSFIPEVAGPDGNIWGFGGNGVEAFDMSGNLVANYTIPNNGGFQMTLGSDGAFWITEEANGSEPLPFILRLTVGGQETEYEVPNTIPFEQDVYGITPGPDGNLWFTSNFSNFVGSITPAGVITEYPLQTVDCGGGTQTGYFPIDIATGSDGALWFQEYPSCGGTNYIGRITTSGSITEYPNSIGGAGLVLGSDGNLWAGVGAPDNTIASISTSGVVTAYSDGSSCVPGGIGGGSDGSVWFPCSGTPGAVGQAIVSPEAPTITSSDNTSVGMRVPVNFEVTSSSAPVASLTESGSLPAGLTFTDNGDGTASIQGVIPAGSAGSYPITITADNGYGTTSQDFTLTVTTTTSAPVITSSASDTESFGNPVNYSVTTQGYPAPALSETGAMPAGLAFTDNGNGTATISGTPTTGSAGVHNLVITATNSVGSTTQNFALTVTKAPFIKAIPSGAARIATVGDAFNLSIGTTGYSKPSLGTSGTLPVGITFTDNGDGTGEFSGTPVVEDGGTYNVTITATNAYGSDSKSITLKVDEGPDVYTQNAVTVASGSSFTLGTSSLGYPAPTFTGTGTLPSGVTFDGATGVLSGTPASGTAGTYAIKISATNSIGKYIQNFTLAIQ